MRSVRSIVILIAIVAICTPLSMAQQERQYGTPATDNSAQPQSIFQTLDAVVVEADGEEGILYLTDVKTEAKVKVLLDEKTKFKIEKKKGGLEMLPSLTEGMEVRVTVNTETGVAVSVKTKKAKG